MAVSKFLLVLSLSCFGLTFSVSSIQKEIQDLKNGQEEIKNLLKEVLYQFNKTENITQTPKKSLTWFEFGSSLLSVNKLTFEDQEKVLVEVELSHTPQTEVDWIVDSTIIGAKHSKTHPLIIWALRMCKWKANEYRFGTWSTGKENSTLYTILFSTSVKFLELISVSTGNYSTSYNIDVNAQNAKKNYQRVCQGAIDDINSTSVAVYFRCLPELDSRDSWYQRMAIYAEFEEKNEVHFKFLESEPNPYVNVTYERNSTATGTVVFSNRALEKFKTFLFLDNHLTLNLNDVVRFITYRFTQDISPEKTNDEFGFLESIPFQEPLEGEKVTIYCDALGRNPPPVRVERDGMPISDTSDVYIASSRSTLWSISYVTYLHASKEIEGNYTCVTDDKSREVFPLYSIELKPKVRWDLNNLMYAGNVTDEGKYLVLEGSEGLDVSCSTFDNDTVVVFDKVQRTNLTKWTERLEVWIPGPSQEFEPYSMWHISCTATDKNGENTFELYL
ncbi:uncharacterized protein [Magallana gigas]|uniref:uncharacterized protein isoform X1 n=1 Tax=Magallana gigas TaxID=29159 RepID=UPI0033409D06